MTPASDDWLEREQPLGAAVVEELQRLKRRARARWLPILLIAIALTAGLLYQRSRRVQVHEAQLVLAVTEGTLSQSHEPMPVQELREYVLEILLTDAAITKIIEAHDLTPLRHKMGMQFAIDEFRDALDIQITRNYFLYEYQIDSPRSARIAISFADPDPELSWTIVQELAAAVVEGQHQRTLQMAAEMARQAKLALADVQAETAALEQEVAEAGVALARAELDNDPRLPAMRVEVGQLHARMFQQNDRIASLTTQADADQTVAAIVTAGLAMSFEVAAEVRPHDEGPPPLYFQILLGAVVFFLALPTVAIFVGAFDTRVHDREDVERLGLPVLGHLPGFPGDGVGSLRARGVRRGRVPS